TYQMLTGMVPFSGESFGDLMLAHLQAIPRPVFELCDGIPPAWNDVVQTALAKDREHRFQSMAAFADAARAALEGREIPRVPVPPPAKGNKTVALPAPPAGASSGYGTGAGSHPGTAIVSNTGSHPGTAIVGSYPGSYPGVASSPGVVVAGDSIPPARSRKLLLPIILGIGVAVVTVGALVVFAGGDSAAAVVDAGAATDAATIAAADAHAPPADAARAAGIPPDAPPPPPPPADAAPAHHHHHRPPRPQGSGYISVTVTPWAYVYIDGKKQGSTPGRWKVSAGRHRIRLVNPELGKQKSLAITVAKDATERVSQRW
ncbi:MAG TPA: PEGA domain-containing protein, partial [Kofleriaceae bacterium]|nr:PEGA domain-containing protein [Kofleriaceae bacterium]